MRHEGVDARAPAALAEDLETLVACDAHLDDVLVALAVPRHLLRVHPPVPGADHAVPRPPHEHLLVDARLLVPLQPPADPLRVQAVLESPTELDEEDVAGLAVERPSKVLALAVGAPRSARATTVTRNCWVEDLPPVLVPHDLEVVAAAQQAHLLGVEAGRRVAALQLLIAPGIETTCEVVLALNHLVRQRLQCQGGHGLLRATDLLPVHCSPLSSNVQRH
mmetsp:Transcript_59166/g.190310  ORF Transcript_59166/g.190310 Transcript_59166/m.190310 type:complete len:221 (+) Transcript_59166:466-1128(+)